MSATESARDSARGVTLMILASLTVPTLDAIAKILGREMPPVEIGVLRYGSQTLILFILLAVLRRKVFTPAVMGSIWRLALSGCFMGIASISLYWSLQYLPLANAIAIFFVGPLILTLFAAIFLGEKVGIHRISAVVAGLVGALIVIRPNFAQFGWPAVLPLMAATAFAAMVTTVRGMKANLDGLRIQTLSGLFATLFLAAVIAGGNLAGAEFTSLVMPSASAWALIGLLGVTATGVQMMMTFAVRLSEQSLLAPFQYLEIVGATAFGYILFDEFPDAITWAGTAIILCAGLYVIHRERQLKRAEVNRITHP
ncbi:DMT family transporter [Acuticoccus sp. MNP-M23]|uniref:DMT family transporter n=1 Tax=Acuticoccus sp. MNP-M23 TaxID=3072793 RepID=UPI002815436E|nr:DMT family transporter [Acuticoccus sp. MNP-M23]WMS43064.1 DMT family transporter [Acuticoccus sp. MNP-M23]